jgi:membrane protease YdiL (CAAX protease family)
LAGVVIYAFIASGIGILATDPLETEVRRRVRPEMVQLYMILAAMYAHALYAPSPWARLAQIVLSALLAFALWQKVRDRAPFLLDPVAAATPAISLSDGMIAALAFFVLQGLCGFVFAASGVPPGAALFVAFVIAGAFVVLFSFYIFWRAQTPHVLLSVGLRRAPGERSMSIAKALLLGVVGGICAATFACAYLYAIDYFPALRSLKTETLKLPFDPGWWLPAIAIGAAPIFEEFIFRGLVFRGLRRSANATVAILGSAAVFAIVHPAISVLPVFVLGLVAAWIFERSKLLISAIVTHMIYNVAVVVMNWYVS